MLERGSVEGEIFHRGAVQALAPEETQVTTRLAALVRHQLVRPDRAQLAGDDGYRFRHLLIRDAAYDALPKAVRADLHARFADWLDEHGQRARRARRDRRLPPRASRPLPRRTRPPRSGSRRTRRQAARRRRPARERPARRPGRARAAEPGGRAPAPASARARARARGRVGDRRGRRTRGRADSGHRRRTCRGCGRPLRRDARRVRWPSACV